ERVRWSRPGPSAAAARPPLSPIASMMRRSSHESLLSGSLIVCLDRWLRSHAMKRMDPLADCGLEPADLHIGFRRDADLHAAEPILDNSAPDEQIAAYTMIGVLAGHGC